MMIQCDTPGCAAALLAYVRTRGITVGAMGCRMLLFTAPGDEPGPLCLAELEAHADRLVLLVMDEARGEN